MIGNGTAVEAHEIDLTALENPVSNGLGKVERGLTSILNTSGLSDLDKTDARQGIQRAFTKYEKVFGTKVFNDPSPDAVLFVKTFRGGILIKRNGEIKTSELMVYPDYELFESSEEERAAVFAETKWTNRGTFIRDQHMRTRDLGRKTILDGDGFALQGPRSNEGMFRALNFLISAELKGFTNIPFLDAPGRASHPEIRSRDNFTGLMRLTRRLPAEALNPDYQWQNKIKPLNEWYENSLSDSIARCLAEDVNVYVRAIKATRQVLDPDVVRLMDIVNDTTVKGYNWLCGFDIPENIRDADGNLVENRDQSGALVRNEIAKVRRANVEKYPLAYAEIRQVYGPINDAIKDGQDVTEALADHYEIAFERMEQFEGIGPNDFKDVGKTIDVRRFYREAKTPENGARMTSEGIARSYLENDLIDRVCDLMKWSGEEKISVQFTPDDGAVTKDGNDQIRIAIDRMEIVSNYLNCILIDPILANDDISRSFRSIISGDDEMTGSVSKGAYGLLTLAHDATIGEFCSRVNHLYDAMYDINRRIVAENPLPRYRIDMSWSSVFGKDVNIFHTPDGASMRPLLSKQDIEEAERKSQIVIPGATLISYTSIDQYAVVSNSDGIELGIVRIKPERQIYVRNGDEFPSRFSPIVVFNGQSAEDMLDSCWSVSDALADQYNIMDRAEIVNLRADMSYRVREAANVIEGRYKTKLTCGYNPTPVSIMNASNLLASYIGCKKVESFPEAVNQIGAAVRDVVASARRSLNGVTLKSAMNFNENGNAELSSSNDGSERHLEKAVRGELRPRRSSCDY